MSDATDLWDRVVGDYDSDGLITLTNIRDRSATSADTTVGTAACQAVIDLWGIYAQEAYDSTDRAHVAVAELGVIAILWRRGGSASGIEQVKWEEVFGPDGAVTKVKRTGARGRGSPSTNSGVSQRSELTSSGQRVRGWSDPESLPIGWLPSRRSANED